MEIYAAVYAIRCIIEMTCVGVILRTLLKSKLRFRLPVCISIWLAGVGLSVLYAVLIPPDKSLLVTLPGSSTITIVAYALLVVIYNIKTTVISLAIFRGDSFLVSFFTAISQVLLLTIDRTICSTLNVYEKYNAYQSKITISATQFSPTKRCRLKSIMPKSFSPETSPPISTMSTCAS